MAGALTLTASLGAGRSAAAPEVATQDAPFNNGTGTASAESMRVNPVSGGLSFGIGVGQALAGHQNTVGSADSRALNLGVIGVTLAGEGCDGGDPSLPADQQPQPVTARSGDEGAETGFTSTETFAGGEITKFARADSTPFAEAITTSAPFDIPGVMNVSGTRAAAHSGVVDGNIREAIATADIDSISLAGGAVVLGGIHTEAIHRSGSSDPAQNTITGSWSIGSASIANSAVPLSNDPVTMLEQLNAALGPLGLEIRAPVVRTADTAAGQIAVVDPLSIGIVPSPLRDGATGPLLGGVQPVRENIFDALLQADCGNSTYITVLDIVLNAISAGGRLTMEFGGVQATTSEIAQFQFGTRPPGAGGGGPTAAPATGASTSGSSGTGSSSSSGSATPARPTTAAPSGAGAASAPSRPTQLDAAPIAQTIVGERGGLMALVAGGGLLLLLASAEGDRRKMRRAQREIPFEA